MKLTKYSMRPGQRSKSWDHHQKEKWQRDSSLPKRIFNPVKPVKPGVFHPTERDSHGRPHYKRPVSGPIYTTVRTSKHHNLTCTSHINDIKPRIEDDVKSGKTVVILSVDGGPDLSVRNTANIMEYGRLWQETKLGVLIVKDFGANLSAYNPIERAWAPITKTMAGVRFHDVLPGEKESPAEQKSLTEEERNAKEKIIFDKAMDEASSLISTASYAGDNIQCTWVECLSVCEKSDKETFEEIHQFTEGPLKLIRSKECAHLVKRYKFYCRHLHRQHNSITFVVCKNDKCSHCSYVYTADVMEKPNSTDLKPRTKWKATENIQKLGYRIPDPEPSEELPGHFLSYIELDGKYRNKKLPTADEHQPSNKKIDVCQDKGCRGYVFFSENDRKRHNKLCHDNKRQNESTSISDSPKIQGDSQKASKCQVCDRVFASPHHLRVHKKNANHNSQRGRKKKS